MIFQPGAPTARHPHARTDVDCHRRSRLGAARGWARRGNPAWRRGLVSARTDALAWRLGDHRGDAHAVQESLKGKNLHGMEKVNDEQYRK